MKNWAWQLTHPENESLPGETPYANQSLLIDSVKETLETGKKAAGRLPKVLVIGAVSGLPPRRFFLVLIISSWAVAAMVPSNWPRMSESPSPTSCSGIWPRPRRVSLVAPPHPVRSKLTIP